MSKEIVIKQKKGNFIVARTHTNIKRHKEYIVFDQEREGYGIDSISFELSSIPALISALTELSKEK